MPSRRQVGVAGAPLSAHLTTELAAHGLTRRDAPDTDDRRTLLAFLDGLDVVVNAGWPSMALIATAVEAGVACVDASTDPAFAADALRAFRQAPTPVVVGCGVETLLGDLAAAVAAEHLGGSCRSVEVHQDGLQAAPRSPSRTIRFPHGVREVGETPSALGVLVPRHARGATVTVTAAARTITDRVRRRDRLTSMVIATADDGERAVVAVLGEGREAVAARLLVTASQAVAGQGAMAPAEALEPERFLDAVRGRDERGELEWAFAFPEGSLAPE